MPRIIRPLKPQLRPTIAHLVEKLANELQSERESGQPLIEERQSEKAETRTVYVYWDEWEGVSEEDRIAVIQRAYENVLGPEFADHIVLAAGYTIPEARDYGLLPYAILSGLRKSDPISAEDCRAALIAEGASVLANPDRPELRFPTMEDAMAAVSRLEKRLPGSRDIWLIAEDVRKAEMESMDF